MLIAQYTLIAQLDCSVYLDYSVDCSHMEGPTPTLKNGGTGGSDQFGADLYSSIEEWGNGGIDNAVNADPGTSTLFSFDDEDSLPTMK